MAGKHISLLVHFTWSTKGREPWINPEWHDPLYRFIGGIMNNKKAAKRWRDVRSHTSLCVFAVNSLDCGLRERREIEFISMDSSNVPQRTRICVARRVWSVQCEQI